MKKLTTRKPSVKLVHGKATTTSLKVAEFFGKEHFRVLRSIENLECSPEFNAANFGAAEYTDAKGEKRPMFTMTKDGFMFLAMGFTGKEAAQWKEKYIEAFNLLEQRAAERRAKPGALKLTHQPVPQARAAKYHYPRKLLEQPYFTSPKAPASLGISMLGDTTQFVSPLFALLNELRSDGHDVSGPWDEAVAMREAIQRADKVMEEISLLSLKGRFKHASTAGN